MQKIDEKQSKLVNVNIGYCFDRQKHSRIINPSGASILTRKAFGIGISGCWQKDYLYATISEERARVYINNTLGLALERANDGDIK